jgi:hypothetical protein
MERAKRAILWTAIWACASALPVCAQQATKLAEIPQGQQATPTPSAFQLTQHDFDLAVQIGHAIAAGDHAQVKKLFMETKVSIPQFERTLGAICDLSAERHFASSGSTSKSSATEVRAMTISNLEDARNQLGTRINEEFGGRGRNYQNAKALVSRQSAAADDVCKLQTPQVGQVR